MGQKQSAFLSARNESKPPPSQTSSLIPVQRPIWLPDPETEQCMNEACLSTFKWFRRRHHCRNCGKIFCNRCSKHRVTLSCMGYIKHPVRVCLGCFPIISHLASAVVQQQTRRASLEGSQRMCRAQKTIFLLYSRKDFSLKHLHDSSESALPAFQSHISHLYQFIEDQGYRIVLVEALQSLEDEETPKRRDSRGAPNFVVGHVSSHQAHASSRFLHALRHADAILCCISPSFEMSATCQSETLLCLQLDKFVLPYLVCPLPVTRERFSWPPLGSISDGLRPYAYIDGAINSQSDATFKTVIASLDTHLFRTQQNPIDELETSSLSALRKARYCAVVQTPSNTEPLEPSSPNLSRQLKVPSEFHTIQQAIDAANHGDAILIASGTYTESLIITKTIELMGQSSSPDDVILQAPGSEPVIQIFTAQLRVINLSIFQREDTHVSGTKSAIDTLTNRLAIASQSIQDQAKPKSLDLRQLNPSDRSNQFQQESSAPSSLNMADATATKPRFAIECGFPGEHILFKSCRITSFSGRAVSIFNYASPRVQSCRIEGTLFVHENGSLNATDCDIIGSFESNLKTNDTSGHVNLPTHPIVAASFAKESSFTILASHIREMSASFASCVQISAHAQCVLRKCRISGGCLAGVACASTVPGTEIDDCTIFGNRMHGIHIASHASPKILNCKVFDNLECGIACDGATSAELTRNELYGNGSAGISVCKGANPQVRYNTLRYSQNFGLVIGTHGRGIFEHNIIFENAGAGVAIQEPGAYPTLRHNQIHHCGAGIWIQKEAGALIEENDISHSLACAEVMILTGGNPRLLKNKLHDGQVGVLVYARGCGTIEANEIYDVSEIGLLIQTGAKPVVRSNLVHGCGNDGMCIRDGGRALIYGNIVFNNAYAGIRIETFAKPTLRKNEIVDNAGVGVSIERGGSCVFKENVLRGNHEGPFWILASSQNRIDLSSNKYEYVPASEIAPIFGADAVPSSGDVKRLSGDALLLEGRYHAALDAYSESLHHSGNVTTLLSLSYLRRALAYMQLDMYHHVIADCSAVLALDLSSSEARLRRAFAYSALGQRNAAFDDLGACLRMDPNNIEAQTEYDRIASKVNGTTTTGNHAITPQISTSKQASISSAHVLPIATQNSAIAPMIPSINSSSSTTPSKMDFSSHQRSLSFQEAMIATNSSVSSFNQSIPVLTSPIRPIVSDESLPGSANGIRARRASSSFIENRQSLISTQNSPFKALKRNSFSGVLSQAHTVKPNAIEPTPFQMAQSTIESDSGLSEDMIAEVVGSFKSSNAPHDDSLIFQESTIISDHTASDKENSVLTNLSISTQETDMESNIPKKHVGSGNVTQPLESKSPPQTFLSLVSEPTSEMSSTWSPISAEPSNTEESYGLTKSSVNTSIEDKENCNPIIEYEVDTKGVKQPLTDPVVNQRRIDIYMQPATENPNPIGSIRLSADGSTSFEHFRKLLINDGILDHCPVKDGEHNEIRISRWDRTRDRIIPISAKQETAYKFWDIFNKSEDIILDM